MTPKRVSEYFPKCVSDFAEIRTIVTWGPMGIELPSERSNAEAICAGGRQGGLAPVMPLALAAGPDGSVVAWETTLAGEADVPSGLEDVVAVAAGGEHAVTLRSDGTLASWDFGWLPPGVTIPPPDLTNAVAVGGGPRRQTGARGQH